MAKEIIQESTKFLTCLNSWWLTIKANKINLTGKQKSHEEDRTEIQNCALMSLSISWPVSSCLQCYVLELKKNLK